MHEAATRSHRLLLGLGTIVNGVHEHQPPQLESRPYRVGLCNEPAHGEADQHRRIRAVGSNDFIDLAEEVIEGALAGRIGSLPVP